MSTSNPVDNDALRRTHHFCGILSQNAPAHSNHEKTSHKFKLRGVLAYKCPALFQNVKVLKDEEERLRKFSQPREAWGDITTHSNMRSWISELEKDTGENTEEMRKTCGPAAALYQW